MIDVLVLNFRRPEETKLCLESIKQNCKFAHYTTLLNNGDHDTDVMYQFYKEGLVHRLVLDKINLGAGFGTIQLFNLALSEYTLWIECDNIIKSPLTKETIDSWIQYLNTDNNKCVDLTGGICGQNVYSGRSFFINTKFYQSLKKGENGIYYGPGPYNNGRYIENYIQEYFKENNFNVGHVNILGDNGKWSIREIGDGVYKHRTDTKSLYILERPTYKTEEYPPFDDEEWGRAIAGEWVDGSVPNRWKNDVFTYWKD